ncbi:MAG TPA: hypothetical protein VJ833_09995 [Rhodanobacteraceae bacterium]|nr:hypothetical protein [Rhodanobacteraceae bacterium]
MNAEVEIPRGAIAFVRSAAGGRIWLTRAFGGYLVSLGQPVWFGTLQAALAVLLAWER